MVSAKIPDWLAEYASLGFKFVFYPNKHKHPVGVEGKEWQTREYRVEDYKPGDNVGVVLGVEIAPGRFLADIDFDWAEGIAQFASVFFPDTGFGFGRPSKKLSHAFYTTSQPVVSFKYEDTDGVTLVEIRGTKTDGSLGLQTMVPPSQHPDGEVLELYVDHKKIGIFHSDTLPRATLLFAIACLFYRHLGKQGFTHDVRLAFAGFMLSEGFTEAEVIKLGNALLHATGNKDVHDVAMTVRTTVKKLHALQPTTGKTALIGHLGADGKKVVGLVRKWAGNSEFITDEKERVVKDSQANIRIALDKLKIKLHRNTFVEQHFIKYNGYEGPLTEEMRRAVYLDIDHKFHFRPTPEFFWTVILREADMVKRHPVLEYLSPLKWDGVPRIEEWLIKCAGAKDTPYIRAVSSLVLIAAVRRVRKPGSKFDELMVLESGQGTFKSSALKALCPNEEWFTDDLPLGVDAKQVIERTGGKWIIEASELHGIRRSEAEHLKSFLSRQVDGPVRLAYERSPTQVPRQFIVIGTTNTMTSYLKDDTGNRRFWPVSVNKFDVDKLLEMRDQLWAEAAQKESEGASTRLGSEYWAAAAKEQEQRRLIVPYEEVISDNLDTSMLRVPANLIWELIGKSVDRRDNRDAIAIASVMQSLGYVRKVKRRLEKGGNPQWVWEKAGVDTLLDDEEGIK